MATTQSSNPTGDSQLHALIGRRKVLLGCGCDSIAPSIAELAGIVGFDVVWADLEHGSAGWPEAELFCQGTRAGGALSLLRVQSAARSQILHALEVGADIVVVPMVQSRATSEKVVRHGKYFPQGNRGFAGSTRALQFGVGDKPRAIARHNRETHLFVQIETAKALKHCREIVSVEGITGALVGPGDLSFSLGRPLTFDAEFVSKYAEAIRIIRSEGKIAATATAHPDLLAAGLEAGLQIIVCVNERLSLRLHWEQTIKEIAAKAGRPAE